MGTTPQGKRPHNGITVSRSTTNKNVDPNTGKSTLAGHQPDATVEKQPERSFAQPSPVAPPKVVTPKAHGSEQDEADALKKNSTKGTQKPAPVKPSEPTEGDVE